MSGFVLDELSKTFSSLVGGSADVTESTKALIKSSNFYSKDNHLGRNLHFGIREHSMGAISNGIALYLSQPVFDSTFFMFSNYMLPAIRMRAMMNLPVTSSSKNSSSEIGMMLSLSGMKVEYLELSHLPPAYARPFESKEYLPNMQPTA